jgi:hypothetical protein
VGRRLRHARLRHFDDFVNPDGEEYLMRYFFNQRTIFKKQPIPAAA